MSVVINAIRNISEKKVTIISDPEGLKIPNVQESEELYVCGDLIDSTVGAGVNADNFLKTKAHNLENIQKCIKRKNVFLTFGNRDLNKLKCKYMCELKNDSNNDVIKSFNDGNIDLSYAKYQELKKTLVGGQAIWKVSHKNWYPYWGGINKAHINIWTGTTSTENTDFIGRYNKIFGADTSVGTMSAQNLIHTIVLELELELELNLDNLSAEEKEEKKKYKEDYKAFVTLAIFRSMCVNNYDDKKKELEIKYIRNSSEVRGWLAELYRKHHACYMLTDNKNNVYLLSHGGVTSTLVQEPEKLSKMRDALDRESLKLLLSDSEKFFASVEGGYYKLYTSVTETPNFDLTEKINTINKIIKDSINTFNATESVNTQGENKEIAFLLTIGTGYNCDIFKNKLKNEEKSTIDCTDIITPLELGPIFPGIESMRNKDLMFIMRGKTLYQIIGHKPIGVNTIVDLYEDNIDKSILINLDISNTFVGNYLNKLDKNENKSDNKLIIEKGELQLLSSLDIDLDKFNVLDFNSDIPKLSTIVDIKADQEKKVVGIIQKPRLYYNSLIKDKIDAASTTDNKLHLDLSNKIDNTFLINIRKITNHSMSYTGYLDNGVHLITHMTSSPGYKVIVFLINDADLKKLNDVQAGGRGSYYQKYLKYKNKYLQLKNQI
jgi:hypothetical protein